MAPRRTAHHARIADALRLRIHAGELPPGAELPSYRTLAGEYGTSIGVVQDAVAALQLEHLVYTVPGKGAYVSDSRRAVGTPRGYARQRRISGAWRNPEPHTVTSADVRTQPLYVAQVLGLEPGAAFVRRETITVDPDGAPQRLAVHWFPETYTTAIPELLATEPLPDEPLALIEGRTGHGATEFEEHAEARHPKDKRERDALGLTATDPVHAVVAVFIDRNAVPVMYVEWIDPPGREIVVRGRLDADED